MKRLVYSAFTLFILLSSIGIAAADDSDSVTAVFSFGRNAGRVASGFAVGDGSYIVTTIDAVTEFTPTGKRIKIPHAAIVSRWTGDVYPATLIAIDDSNNLGLLKIDSPAVPPIALLDDKSIEKIPLATLGQVLSGEEAGGKYGTEIYGLQLKRNPDKFVVDTWRVSKACLTEVKRTKWVFLSKVEPETRAPKAALVVKPGSGAVGVFLTRLVVEGGQKPVTFLQVLSASILRNFLIKSKVPAETLSKPTFSVTQASDAETAFQVLSTTLSLSTSGASGFKDAAAAAVKIRPKNATVQLLFGISKAIEGKFDEAIKAIDTAIELDPALPDARMQRGLILAAAGKTSEAEQELRKAVKDNPKDVRPLISLADLLLPKEDNLDECQKLAKEAIDIAPDDPSGRMMLGRVLKRKKDYDGAISELQKVIESAPNWPDPRAAIALVYEAAGKLDLAEAQYRKLVEIGPQSPDAHLALIDFLIVSGKKDDAKKAIEAAKTVKMPTEALEQIKKMESQLESDNEKKD